MRGHVENAPTATGESRDGVRGKRAQLGLGLEGDARGCDGGMRIDRCRPQSEELGEGDESYQCRAIGLGSCVEGGATGPRTLSRTGACEGESLRCRYYLTVPQAWGTGRGGKPTPTEGSRLSMRGRESSAQSVDRVTQRECALSLLGRPFGEQRSILGGRSRVWDGPSRFLGRETLEKPETEPSITDDRGRWQRKQAASPESLPAMRQRWACGWTRSLVRPQVAQRQNPQESSA